MKILLVVYDNESYISHFPIAISYLAGLLRSIDQEVVIYHQDVHHYPEEHLTKYLNENDFDFVGISIICGYYQYKKLLLLSEAINKSIKRSEFVFMIGGHMVSPDPIYFLRKTLCDIIVMGEGEETLKQIVNDVGYKKEGFEKNKLDNIEGIGFRIENEYYVNRRRNLISDIDSIPMPAYDLLPIEHYRLNKLQRYEPGDFMMYILSGRGCKYHCNFCYRMDKGFRPRSAEKVFEEMLYLNDKWNINYFYFFDELFMSSLERIELFCELFKNKKNKIKNLKWMCNGRLNFAKKDILKNMKESGCVFINYGVESLDDFVLKQMKKCLTEKIIIRGVENTKELDIGVGLNMIFGNIGDSKESLEKSTNFLLKYGTLDELRTIRPVTPYPGTPLYTYAIENGLLEDMEDFYENKHINSDLMTCNFTNLSEKEYYECLKESNKKIVLDYSIKKQNEMVNECEKLYDEKNIKFRGFRSI